VATANSFIYTYGRQKIANQSCDWINDTFKGILVGASTTADTEKNVTALAGFTTLDECNATGYAQVALTTTACNADTTDLRCEFDADDIAFGALGNGTNFTIQGLVIYDDTEANDQPIVYVEFASTVGTNSGTITVVFSADGIFTF